MTVVNSDFMVGPINSYPNAASNKQSRPGANINWFGDLPEDIHRLNEYTVWFFLKLAAFFQVKTPHTASLSGA